MQLPINYSPLRFSPSFPIYTALAFLVTLLPLCILAWNRHVLSPYLVPISPLASSRAPDINKQPDEWLQTWLAHPLLPERTFNPSAISRYCNDSTWYPNLVFRLDNANGGIGNVRGNILDFIFFAVEAGASIVLPSWARRNGGNIGDVWGGGESVQWDEWFDEEWFLSAMASACPQMVVYKPKVGQELVEAVNGERGNFMPGSRRVDEEEENTKERWTQRLDEWLGGGGREGRREELTVVNLERTLWDVDTRSLPDGARRNIGMLMRVKEDARRLAGIVVREMSRRFELDIHPGDTIPRGKKNAKGGFYGAHLRTEMDAVNAGWLAGGNFSAQTDAYIQQAVQARLNVMYVASGNITELQFFAAKAAAHKPPIAVVTKFDLLPEAESRLLKSMSWDQQALVDYEVLQRCSKLGGFVKSSFSYNLGMKRNQWLQDQGRVLIDPWMVQHSELGVSFDDGLSRMVGRDDWHEHRIPRGMWP